MKSKITIKIQLSAANILELKEIPQSISYENTIGEIIVTNKYVNYVQY